MKCTAVQEADAERGGGSQRPMKRDTVFASGREEPEALSEA